MNKLIYQRMSEISTSSAHRGARKERMMENQEKAQQLLSLYNEYEEKLFSGGNDYRDIPEHAWGDLEAQIQDCGFELVQPQQGYSTLKPAVE